MGLLDTLFGKDANPDPKNLSDYATLLEAAKKNPASTHYVSLRKAFKASALYHPYENSSHSAFEALDLLKAGKSAEAVSVVKACLEKYYLDVDAHLCASIIYRELGDQPRYLHHNHFTQGLIKAIMSTGDGKSFETAYEVLNISEEYSIMNVLGIKQQKRKTVMHNNRKYDVHQVTDKSGSTFELYFNVDFNTSVPVAAAPPMPANSKANNPVLKIGNVEWMTRNLNTDKFNNGEIIPEAKTKEEWIKAGREGKPAWCYHDNDASLASDHGKLYNWFAISDPRGLLPEGWRIPDNNDWLQLINGFGGKGSAGINLKSTSGWNNNGNGTNQSGFNGLPSGGRIFENESSAFAAMFTGLGQVGNWWSLEESGKEKAWTYSLVFMANGVARLESRKEAGCSVRAVRGAKTLAPVKEVVATIYFSSNQAITENTLREAARPFAPVGKINWSNKSSDSHQDKADGPSYFYVEESEARGTFKFCYTLWWRALPHMPDQRQQVEFLKRISSLQGLEILTHAGGHDPYLFIYLQPGEEATLVGIDVDADNNNDELKIESFTSTGWGTFAVPNMLNMDQMRWIRQSFQEYVPVIKIGYIARDRVNPHFIEGQLDLVDLQPFVNHYMIFPEGKCRWYSDDEKSIASIKIFEEFLKTFQVPVCLFPVNGSVIENIPGGSDSESHCILIREKGSQKIVYKTRRKSW